MKQCAIFLPCKAVKKILRDAYKRLKEVPNLSRKEVTPGARVHVVGDLHGQVMTAAAIGWWCWRCAAPPPDPLSLSTKARERN